MKTCCERRHVRQDRMRVRGTTAPRGADDSLELGDLLAQRVVVDASVDMRITTLRLRGEGWCESGTAATRACGRLTIPRTRQACLQRNTRSATFTVAALPHRSLRVF
jgi:hypothetical protein